MHKPGARTDLRITFARGHVTLVARVTCRWRRLLCKCLALSRSGETCVIREQTDLVKLFQRTDWNFTHAFYSEVCYSGLAQGHNVVPGKFCARAFGV